MKFKYIYEIGLEDVDINGNASNKAIMTIMEDIGGRHSDSAGLGIREVKTTGLAWVVLDWKIKILRRPVYRDSITAYTWSRKHNTVCAYRDFELFDEHGEKIAAASSRWVLMDINRRRPARLTEELAQKYQEEQTSAAFKDELENVVYPRDFFDTKQVKKQPYKVLRREIDSNLHMHNLCYLEAAQEILPREIYLQGEKNNIRISYKKEIRYGEAVTGGYIFYDNKHIVCFQDSENTVRAIVELY